MEKKERRITEKQLKMMILVFVIIVIVLILVWTMVPGRIYEVSDLLERSPELQGETVKAKGLVRDWSFGNDFILADSFDDNVTIQITHMGTYPDGFSINETVVVEGNLVSNAGGLSIMAEQITIGCPSNY